MPETQPIAIIACAVLREAIAAHPEASGIRTVIMDYGLHLSPARMRDAIQAEIDALTSPHLVLLGYGLCGNGVVGLKSRGHTLVIPRADDCISLFLGSRAAYLREFQAEPGTFYLTPGWLECGGEPLSEYRKYCEKYGIEKAELIMDAEYHRYRRTCLVGFSHEEVERYRPRALQVAEFCRKRWGWQYVEQIGSDAFIRRLLKIRPADAAHQEDDDFVIVPPGTEVRQEPFMQVEATLQEESGPCTICTIK